MLESKKSHNGNIQSLQWTQSLMHCLPHLAYDIMTLHDVLCRSLMADYNIIYFLWILNIKFKRPFTLMTARTEKVSSICIQGLRTQPPNFCWVSCVINSQDFLRLHWCWHTFASLWSASIHFDSLWHCNLPGDPFLPL